MTAAFHPPVIGISLPIHHNRLDIEANKISGLALALSQCPCGCLLVALSFDMASSLPEHHRLEKDHPSLFLAGEITIGNVSSVCHVSGHYHSQI
ncbi:MAG: hypothetical protein ACRC8G_09090 [Plesiomonas shigelloides]